MKITEEIITRQQDLYKTLNVFMMAATGLSHLSHQIAGDNPLELIKRDADLSKDFAETFADPKTMGKIIMDENKSLKLVQFLDQINELRESMVKFAREV